MINEISVIRYTLFFAVLLFCGHDAFGQQPHRVERDIQYHFVDGVSLQLDLYLPAEQAESVPCIVFVHGGGWKNGDKKSAAKIAAWIVDEGFAVASINYRLTDVAPWPAQIDDCYSAVRWVRKNAKQYGIDAERVGAWGTSAGGHLAALMGTRKYPGKETVSSQVQAVCDWFGPSELLTMPPNNVGNGRTKEDVAKSNGAKLLGATVRDVPLKAKDASAIDNVSSDDAGFLIMHGDQDPNVPISQSTNLHARLVRSGVASQLAIVKGAGHGGKLFNSLENRSLIAAFFRRQLKGDWNQGPGASGRFTTSGTPPTQWSVVRDQNIAWRKTLPETGQSTVVTSGDRIFFTTMESVDSDASLGSNIVAYCCDSATGETVWQRKISGDYPLRLSGCFSDSSSPSPVTNGKYVCFFNASGRIVCFDLDGNKHWEKAVMPVGRTQPLLIDNRVVFIRQAYMPDEHGHFTHAYKNAPLEKWTQLQALDIETGKEAWATKCGINMGCIPLPLDLPDGRRVLVVGRGGGHSPPEKPDGISMVDATDGKTIWTLALPKFMSTMTLSNYGDHILVFDAGDHLWVNATTGKIDRRVSIVKDTPVRIMDPATNTRSTVKRSIAIGKKTRAIIQQSNLLVGRYHYFRSYTEPWLGRVDAVSGKVQYLQLPVQLKRTSNSMDDHLLWRQAGMAADVIASQRATQRKAPKSLPVQLWVFAPNYMKNSRGHVVMGDNRSQGNGWGHHASAIPTAVGDFLFVPTMSGTVYVVRWNHPELDETAIVAINDLGPTAESWNRASLSYSDGKIFAHTIREVIAIESQN